MRKWDINYINCESYGISTKQFLNFRKRYYVLEMKESGLVIGHAYFYRDADGDRSIKNLEVRLLGDFIDKGFGTEILECAKKEAVKFTHGLSYLCRLGDYHAQRILEKCGFEYIKTLCDFRYTAKNPRKDFYYYRIYLK